MDLSVITVTWNSAAHITEQIKSVAAACTGITYEQFVVDNGSKDDTVQIAHTIVGAYGRTPLRVLVNNHNVGFGAANNQGAALAKGEFLLFLNPDMQFLDKGSLAQWIEWMRTHPKVGISGCKLVNNDGSVNVNALPRRFPTLFDQLMILFKVPHLFPSILDKYLYKGFDANKEQEVDSVRGSCMLVRRELVTKLGFAFDPRYYIWYEDVDVCREAYRNGFTVKYTPLVAAQDLIGQSFKKRSFFWKQVQMIKSMITYFLKWGF